ELIYNSEHSAKCIMHRNTEAFGLVLGKGLLKEELVSKSCCVDIRFMVKAENGVLVVSRDDAFPEPTKHMHGGRAAQARSHSDVYVAEYGRTLKAAIYPNRGELCARRVWSMRDPSSPQ